MKHSTFSVTPSVDDGPNDQKFYQTRLFKVAVGLLVLTILLFVGGAVAFGGKGEQLGDDPITVNVVDPVVVPGPLDPVPVLKEASEVVFIPGFIQGGRFEPAYRQVFSVCRRHWKVISIASVVVVLLSLVAVGLYVNHQQQLEAQRIAEEEELQRQLEAAAEEERQKELANQEPIISFYAFVLAMYALSLLATIGVLVDVHMHGAHPFYPSYTVARIFTVLLGFFTGQTLVYVLAFLVDLLKDKVILIAQGSPGVARMVLKLIGIVLHLIVIVLYIFLAPIALVAAILGGHGVWDTLMYNATSIFYIHWY